MSFSWVGGGKLSETCRNELWAQALEKAPFQQSFVLLLLSFFQEDVTEQLVMKSPPQPCYLTPLASQGHQV